MRRIEIEDAEIMRIAVQQEIARNKDARYDHRLHCILLACDRMSPFKIAELFGDSPRAIQYWIKQFNEDGFAGLHEEERPGRPKVITQEILNKINIDLRKNPRDLGYRQNLWDGKLLSHHLWASYHVQLGIRQCQRLFHKLGFRQRKPRPIIASANEDLREEFKKREG